MVCHCKEKPQQPEASEFFRKPHVKIPSGKPSGPTNPVVCVSAHFVNTRLVIFHLNLTTRGCRPSVLLVFAPQLGLKDCITPHKYGVVVKKIKNKILFEMFKK